MQTFSCTIYQIKNGVKMFFFPILLQHHDKSETSDGKSEDLLICDLVVCLFVLFQTRRERCALDIIRQPKKFLFLLVRQHLNGSIKGRPLLRQTVFDWENQELFILVMFSQVTLQTHVCTPPTRKTPTRGCKNRETVASACVLRGRLSDETLMLFAAFKNIRGVISADEKWLPKSLSQDHRNLH